MMPMTVLVKKPTTMNPTIDLMLLGIEVRQLLAPVPADGDQQINRQRLVHDIGKLEMHPQDRHQEPKIEEEQQGLEQVVPEVVPEFAENRLALLLPHPPPHELISSTVILEAVIESVIET